MVFEKELSAIAAPDVAFDLHGRVVAWSRAGSRPTKRPVVDALVVNGHLFALTHSGLEQWVGHEWHVVAHSPVPTGVLAPMSPSQILWARASELLVVDLPRNKTHKIAGGFRDPISLAYADGQIALIDRRPKGRLLIVLRLAAHLPHGGWPAIRDAPLLEPRMRIRPRVIDANLQIVFRFNGKLVALAKDRAYIQDEGTWVGIYATPIPDACGFVDGMVVGSDGLYKLQLYFKY